jgi:hypothetical protein
MTTTAPVTLGINNQKNFELVETGEEYGLPNHLVCNGNNLFSKYNDYLRIRNDKLELIIYICKTPSLILVDIFELYVNVIKLQTKEATTKFLESVEMLEPGWPDIKEKYGIVPVTPESLKPFIENGVLKPFCCIFEG